MGPTASDVTLILQRLADGEREAAEDLLPVVYDELRSQADRYLRRERVDHTLQPTALVHEAYLKLVKQDGARWNNRAHFFAVATTAMRRILVNHALAKKSLKRGGDHRRTPLSQVIIAAETRSIDLIALDEALKTLATMDERQSKIVELRFFGGLTAKEVAEALDVSLRTIEGEWSLAKAWLYRQIGSEDGGDA